MERRRLQQQKMKQQQRFCVSHQELTEAIDYMKTQRRATYNNIMNISSSCSIDTLTIPSVSQIIKEFEARSISTPYVSAQDFISNNNDIISNEAESNCFQKMSVRTIKIKVNKNDDNNRSSSISCLDNDQILKEKIHQDQFIGDKEQIDQTLNNDRYKRELPSSSSSSSYYSIDNNNNTIQMVTRNTNINSITSKRHDKRFDEILTKEAQLNNALADLISLSNDADISSSISSSSSSRSLTNIFQHQRTSSTNDNTNSISASIALLNNLLETFDFDNEDLKKKNNKKNTNYQNSQKNDNDNVKPINTFCLITSDNVCANCHQSFTTNEQIVNAAGQIWHTQCFVCAQCFQPFENGIYFEHEGRKYCERDFQTLFAPCCAECKQVIVGRIIRALQKCFHPDCFRCQLCHIPLFEIGFSKNNGRALCRECYTKEKAKDPSVSQYICSTCQQIIDNKCIKYKGEYYHAYHFQCSSCRIELDHNAREVHDLLYCQSCYNKLDLPVCAACRRLIDGRVVSALGKQWHVEHFCCARCGQPFCGSKHYENNGLAYCEIDYHILFGSTCFICNRIITNGAYTACNKKYCPDHFACSQCETKMNEKSKFFDVDATPVCKQCYGKLPSDTRKSLQQNQKRKSLSCIFKQKKKPTNKETIQRALAYTITSSKISSSCTTTSILTSNSFDETDDQSTSSMTTTSSNRRLSGRGESSTIPTPHIHSSIDTSPKTSNLLNNSISNTRRSRKSIDNKILYPNNIILESQSNNKNINYYIPPVPDISLNESEQKIKTKYTELLINFFETHQPSYIFEPLRKEYYWTNEPFNEDKTTRLDKLLHSTSYFVQSIFWYLRILLAICVTIPIEIIHTILAGLIKPILIRVPIIISDTLIKPFYSGLFNSFILPIGILLWNTSDLFAKTFEPFIRLFTLLFEPCIDCFRSIRQSSLKQINEQQLDNGDGYHHMEQKKSTLYV
ncbi:unnamed protein product [Rotaria sordida]|uniref:LIM zinc-binding domain-containing protein n=1 Tax=Rotaria sordida TaxID=392033 RepID=A0A814T1B0_9BILA|nr:unnamed protein product [Rotaria sordida]